MATAVLLLAASAGAAGRYTDPSGDSNGAPDITGASVSSGPNGQIVFDIRIPNLPSPADVRTYLFINADNDANGQPRQQRRGLRLCPRQARQHV